MPRISFSQISLLDWIVVTVGLLDLSDSWGRKTAAKNFSNQFFSPSSLSISHAFCPKSRPRVSSSCVLPSPANVLAILYLVSSGCLPQYHNSETFQSSYFLFVPYHDLQVLENPPIWTHSSIFPSWEGVRTMIMKMTMMNVILTMTVITMAATMWWGPTAATVWSCGTIYIRSTVSLNKAQHLEGIHIDWQL